ncbi:Calx-beta domain-containing protein, partial [Verrucomicrobiales bacterium BCK34]|nr:Calx-beta domain-containing protein [Verrucomicrobiales bacterium BCK34]
MKRTTSSRRKRWFFARSMARAYQEWLERRTRSGKKPARKATQRPLFAEALEPRVLFSGTPVPVEEMETGQEDQAAAMAQTAELLDSSIDGIEEFSFDENEDINFTEADLERLASEAASRWEASGLTEEQIAALEEINYVVTDLEGSALAYAEGSSIYIDNDAAGYDWFVDETEWLDEEFVAYEGYLEAITEEAIDGIDLLTAIMHEQGHILGLEDEMDADEIDGLLAFKIGEGVRRLPESGAAEGATPLSLEGRQFLSAAPDFSGAVERYHQDSESGFEGFNTGPTSWSGSIAVVPSGTDGVPSLNGASHAVFTQTDEAGGLTGPFTRFDGYRSDLGGGIATEVSIYLDPSSLTAGEGFEFSVASNRDSGGHLRDFVFHVTKDSSSGELLVGASNNANIVPYFHPREDLEAINHAAIGSAGWYTFEHIFYENSGGSLDVEMNVFDSGDNLIFTEVRNNQNDTEFGGNRYLWFTGIQVDKGIAIDQVSLRTIDSSPVQLFSGNSTSHHDSIQSAIDAASEGDRIEIAAGTYNESINLNKAVSLAGAGVGQTIITPLNGSGIEITGDLGTDAIVNIDGIEFKASPNGSGIDYANTAILGTLNIVNSKFEANFRNGVEIGGDGALLDLDNVIITDTEFVGNGEPQPGGTNGDGDILLYQYNGDATISNVTITGQDRGNGAAENAIQLRSTGVMGTVSLTNVSISGVYEKVGLAVYSFENIDNLSASGVTVSAETGWNTPVNFDGIGSTVDVTGLGIDVSAATGEISIQGNGGANTLTSGDEGAFLRGRAGDDVFTGNGGDDTIIGDETDTPDAGIDTAVFKGNFADFEISPDGDTITISDLNAADGDEGTDTLYGIEKLQFADVTISVASIGDLSDGASVQQAVEEQVAANPGEPVAINGTSSQDTIVIDLSSGNWLPERLIINGGGQGAGEIDTLVIIDSSGSAITYTPDANTFGNGNIVIEGKTIEFSDFEPVDFDIIGGGTFTLNLPNGDDVVDITSGTLAAGVVDALILSGSSGGISFETAHVRGATEIIINTEDTETGSDAITITSADGNHGNGALTINTGNDAGDSITVNGPVDFGAGTVTLSTAVLNLNSQIAAGSITGSTVTVNVSSAASIQDGIDLAGAGGTVNVAAGTYSENLLVDKGVSIAGAGIGSTIIDATGNIVTLTSGNVTISSLTLQNGSQGIRLDNAGATLGNVTIDSVAFTDLNSRGIEIHNATTVTDFEVLNSTFSNNKVAIRMASTAIGDGILIDNIRVEGGTYGFYQAAGSGIGTVRNVEITNSSFVDLAYSGVYAEEITESTIDGNTFSENRYGVILYNADAGAGEDIENLVISGNTFTDQTGGYSIYLAHYGSAIAGPVEFSGNMISSDVGELTQARPSIEIILDGGFVHGPLSIEENVVSFSGSFGVAEFAAAMRLRGSLDNIDISRNRLDGGNVGNNGGNPPTSGIVLLSDDIAGTADIDITYNFVRGFENGLSVYDSVGSTFGGLTLGADLTVFDNDLSGNTVAIVSGGGEIVNAVGNWYGSDDPEVVSPLISGNVAFSPFLADGTDTDPDAAGFQGDQTNLIFAPGADGDLVVSYNSTTGEVETRDGSGTLLSSVAIDPGSTLTLEGDSGDNTFTIDFTGTDNSWIPVGGIVVNGNGQATAEGDILRIIDDGGEEIVYRPDTTTFGDGFLVLSNAVEGDKTITFTGLEPVDVIGAASFTLSLPNAADNVLLTEGKLSGGGGVDDAIVISGTSEGVPFEVAHVRNTGELIIDTTAVAGTDTINVARIFNNHGNGDLTINTGNEAGDTVTIGYDDPGTINDRVQMGGKLTITSANVVFANQFDSSAAAGDGAISITADSLDIQGAINVNQSTVTILQMTNGRTIGLGDTGAGGLNLTSAEIQNINNGAELVTIGDVNTGAVDIANAIVDQNFSITGSDISVANFVNTVTTRQITLNTVGSVTGAAGAGTDIEVRGLAIVSGSGVGTGTEALEINSLLFDAEVTTSATGGINVINTGADLRVGDVNGRGLSTQGGDIIVKSAGRIVTFEGTGGVHARGGDIRLETTASAGGLNGIELRTDVTTTGTGRITITGMSTSAVGVEIEANHSVTTSDGAITITGTSTNGRGIHALGGNAGSGTGVIMAGGANDITIDGTGGFQNGIFIDSSISTMGGNILIRGENTGTGDGVIARRHDITTNGAGIITFEGIGGIDGEGLDIDLDGAISTGSGAITFTGTTVVGGGSGIKIDDTTVTTSGTITVNGTGGTAAVYGVGLFGANLNSADDLISIKGVSAGGSGVYINNGTGSSVLVGEGVTIMGTGNGDGTSDDHGVDIRNASLAPETATNLTITGISANDSGVFFRNTTAATAGIGTITINGTGGANDDNHGVFFDSGAPGNQFTTVDGDLTVIGSSGDAHGVNISGSTNIALEATGSGNVILDGDGGSDPDDYGVYVAGSNSATLRSNTGDVIITAQSAEGVYLFRTAEIHSTTGDITLTADKLGIDGLSGPSDDIVEAFAGSIRIQPFDVSKDIGLGDGSAGDLVVDLAIIDHLNPATALIVGSIAGTGAVDIQALDLSSATYDYDVSVIGGSIALNQLNVGTSNNVILTANTGQINDAAGTDIIAQSVTLNGDAAPGLVDAVGLLNLSGNVLIANDSVFTVDIDSTTPGEGPGKHDQLVATGAITIGTGVDLVVDSFFAATEGDTFTIVTGSSVAGTFEGKPDGTIFDVGTDVFRINYTATDVILTFEGKAETSVTIDGSNNLVISDILNDSPDDLTIEFAGGEYIITDTDQAITTMIAGAIRVTAHQIKVPAGAFAGGLVVNTAFAGGDAETDKVTITSLPASIAGDVTILANDISVGTSITATGTITLGGAAVLTSSVELDGANVILTDTLNMGANNLTVSTTGATGAANGEISGTGTLTKQGVGSFALNAVNTFDGDVTIEAGELDLGIDNAIDSSVGIDIDGGGTLDLNGNPVAIAELTGAGAVTIGAATLTVGSGDVSSTFDGSISGPGGANLIKTGTGTLTLNGATTYQGTTSVDEGILVVNNTHTGGATYSVAANATLGGDGAISAAVVSTGGIISPDLGAIEDLGTGGLTLDSASTFTVQLNGTSAGVLHDQLDVTGAVDLGDAILDMILGYKPDVNDELVIIDSNTAIGTIFDGYPEGTVFELNSSFDALDYTFQITYSGGVDGKDVVLTCLGVPETSVELSGGNLNISDIRNGSDDTLTIVLDGGDYVITDLNRILTSTSPEMTRIDEHTIRVAKADVTGSVVINTTNGNDLVTLDYRGGDLEVDVTFNGGNPMVAPGDVLRILDNNTQSAVYTPDAGTTGSGAIVMNSGTISFTGLEPVDFDGFASVTVTTSGTNDVLTIGEGSDSATGLVDAMIVSGTSDGVVIEAAHISNTTNVIVTTATGTSAGIILAETNNGHGNTNLTVITGETGNDTFTLSGEAIFAGDVDIQTKAIDLTGGVLKSANATFSGQAADALAIGDQGGVFSITEAELTTNLGVTGKVTIGRDDSTGTVNIGNADLSGESYDLEIVGGNEIFHQGALSTGGTITISANQDGIGAHRYYFFGGGSLTTTNSSATAVTIDVAESTGLSQIGNITVGSGGSVNVGFAGTGGLKHLAGTTINAPGSGNVVFNSTGALTIEGTIDAGSGEILINANTDGIGTQSLSFNEAAILTTTNTGTNAIRLNANNTTSGTGQILLAGSFTTGAGGSIIVATDADSSEAAANVTIGETTIDVGATGNFTVNADDELFISGGKTLTITDGHVALNANTDSDDSAGTNRFYMFGGASIAGNAASLSISVSNSDDLSHLESISAGPGVPINITHTGSGNGGFNHTGGTIGGMDSGDITINATGRIVLNGTIDAGSSLINIDANSDGDGNQALTMGTSAVLTTTSSAANAIDLRANDADSGTGSITLGGLLETGAGGGILVSNDSDDAGAGGDINFQTLTVNPGAGGSFIATADDELFVQTGHTVTFVDGDVTLNANADGSGAHRFYMFDGATIQGNASSFQVNVAETTGTSRIWSVSAAAGVDLNFDLNGTGTIQHAGGILGSADSGKIFFDSEGGITLAGEINAGSSVIDLRANTNGSGNGAINVLNTAELSTTNATNDAISLRTNTTAGTGSINVAGSFKTGAGGKVDISNDTDDDTNNMNVQFGDTTVDVGIGGTFEVNSDDEIFFSGGSTFSVVDGDIVFNANRDNANAQRFYMFSGASIAKAPGENGAQSITVNVGSSTGTTEVRDITVADLGELIFNFSGTGKILTHAGTVLTAAAGTVTLRTDHLDLGGSINTTTGDTNLFRTTGGTIGVGSGTGGLQVSQAEIGRITSGTLTVGDDSSGTANATVIDVDTVDTTATITGVTRFNAQSGADADVIFNGANAFNTLEVTSTQNIEIEAAATIATAGGGNAIFTADVEVNGTGEFTTGAGSSITTAAGAGGTITVSAATVELDAAGNLNSGAGEIIIQPVDIASTIGLAGGAGILNLTNDELATLTSTNKVTIGNSLVTGALTAQPVDVSAGSYDLDLFGGSVMIESVNVGPDQDLTVTANFAAITGSSATLTAEDVVLTAASTIGTNLEPIALVATTVTTASTDNQFLTTATSVSVNGFNAGIKMVQLNGGEFDLVANDVVADTTKIVVENGATLDADAIDTLAGIIVKDGGILKGDGALGGAVTVESGGTITPGEGMGTEDLATGNLTLDPGANYTVRLNGTANADFDQLDVTGTVNLTGALLASNLDFIPTLNDTFVIVDNLGVDPIGGTFAGYPEGHVFSLVSTADTEEYVFTITYLGGNGNDVMLTNHGIAETSVEIVGNDLVITDIGGGNSDDAITITDDGAGNYLITDPNNTLTTSNGAFTRVDINTISVPNGSFTGSIVIDSLAGDDVVTLDYSSGNFINTDFVYNGGGQTTGDALKIIGSSAETAVYTPDATVPGNGVIELVKAADSSTITFTGLEPIDFDSLASVTVSPGGTDDVLAIAEGFDSLTGLIPALVISGTTDGNAIEAAHIWNTADVIIDTSAAPDGSDSISINGGTANAHGIANLTVITGNTGSDTVTLTGDTTLSGDVSIQSRFIELDGGAGTAVLSAANATFSGQDGDVFAIGSENNNLGFQLSEAELTTNLNVTDTVTIGRSDNIGDTLMRIGNLDLTGEGYALNLVHGGRISQAGDLTVDGAVRVEANQNGQNGSNGYTGNAATTITINNPGAGFTLVSNNPNGTGSGSSTLSNIVTGAGGSVTLSGYNGGALKTNNITAAGAGNVFIDGSGSVEIDGLIDAGSGLIDIDANTDDTGAQSLTVDTAGGLKTTNTTANAITLTVNDAANGDGRGDVNVAGLIETGVGGGLQVSSESLAGGNTADVFFRDATITNANVNVQSSDLVQIKTNQTVNMVGGTFTALASKDGTGNSGFSMEAGSSLISDNTTAGAIDIDVIGDTASATFQSVTVGTGGTLNVNVDGEGGISHAGGIIQGAGGTDAIVIFDSESAVSLNGTINTGSVAIDQIRANTDGAGNSSLSLLSGADLMTTANGVDAILLRVNDAAVGGTGSIIVAGNLTTGAGGTVRLSNDTSDVSNSAKIFFNDTSVTNANLVAESVDQIRVQTNQTVTLDTGTFFADAGLDNVGGNGFDMLTGSKVITGNTSATAIVINSLGSAGANLYDLTVGDGGSVVVDVDGSGLIQTLAGGVINSSGSAATVSLDTEGAITLRGEIDSGSSTIKVLANSDGSGTESLTMFNTATLTTTNTEANSIFLKANAATGGTGDLTIAGTLNSDGGILATTVSGDAAGGANLFVNDTIVNLTSSGTLSLQSEDLVQIKETLTINGGLLDIDANLDADGAGNQGFDMLGGAAIVSNSTDVDAVNIRVNTAVGGNALTDVGNITVGTGGGIFVHNEQGSIVTQTGTALTATDGVIELRAIDLTLDGSIAAGTGTATISRSTMGSIGVGVSGDMEIDAAELARIVAATLNVGDAVQADNNSTSILVDSADTTVGISGVTRFNALSGATANVEFTGASLANEIEVNATGDTATAAGASISTAAANGNITITSATVTIDAATSAIDSGGGEITIKPFSDTSTIGLGGGAGALNLEDAELAVLASTNKVTIGSATGSGAVDIDAVDLGAGAYDLDVVGGSISVEGLDTDDKNTTLIATSGDITSGGATDNVTAAAVTLSAVNGSIGAGGSPVTLNANSISTDTSTSNGNQFISEFDSVIVTAFNAGGGVVQLEGGEFDLATDDAVADTTSIVVEAGAILDADATDTLANVTVKNGGTLKGDGSLVSSVTVESGGSIAPGEGAIGSLATGSLDIEGQYLFELSGAGDTSDVVNITGNLDISNAILAISELSPADDAEYLIATYTGALTGATFASVTGVPTGYGIEIDETAKTIKLIVLEIVVTETGGSTDATEGGATDTIEVSLNAFPGSNVTVTVTPDPEVDLGAGAGVAVTLTFTPTDATTPQIVSVTAFDDILVEGPDIVSIDFTSAGLVTKSVDANITDNDIATWSISGGGNVNEGDSGSYTISLDGILDVNETATIDLSLSNGTTSAADYDTNANFLGAVATVAAARADLTLVGNTLTYTGDGVNPMADLVFSFDTEQDAIVEADETFDIVLSNPASTTGAGIVVGTSSTTTTIIDDDTAAVTIEDVSVSEDGTMTFTATLDTAVQDGFSIDVLFTDGTATGGNTDYDGMTQTITFTGGAGEEQTFTVALNNDAIVESDETFTLTLSSLVPVTAPAGSINISDGATGTIENNDSTTVTIADAVLDESGGLMTFTATLGNAVQGGFKVDVIFADGTATGGTVIGGDDFANALQTLNFDGDANETQTFTVAITNDSEVEGDETFNLSMTNVLAGAGIDTNDIVVTDTAIGTITNNDIDLVIVADQGSLDEGQSGNTQFTFTVTRAGRTDGVTTVDYAVTSAQATAADFGGAFPTGTVTFAANELTKTITIDVAGDRDVETDETFTVTLSNASDTILTNQVDIETATALSTITNDDIDLVISPAIVTHSEGDAGNTTYTYTVTRTGALDGTTTVNWGVSGSGANPAVGADFGGSFPGGTLVFAGGQTTKTITIQVSGDNTVEMLEGFTVTLSSQDDSIAEHAVDLATATALGEIVNDDAAKVSIGNAAVVEGGNLEFTVTLDNPVDVDTIVTYSTADGTATTADSDYTGQASQMITILA